MEKRFLEKRDWILWIASLVVVIGSNLVSSSFDLLTLVATIVGVSSLIFAAKGYLISQILMIIFSVLYGIISIRFHYWGEIVTYLGMTMPMAIWAMISWLKNRSSEGYKEVKIHTMRKIEWLLLTLACVVVSIALFFVLKYFGTPNLIFSTLSVATSFFGASLTIMRSSFFGLAYSLNDIVLIVLWVSASIENPSYIPVVVNFAIFFINDLYGFVNWKIREKVQPLK